VRLNLVLDQQREEVAAHRDPLTVGIQLSPTWQTHQTICAQRFLLFFFFEFSLLQRLLPFIIIYIK